jgi:hypothetical protein
VGRLRYQKIISMLISRSTFSRVTAVATRWSQLGTTSATRSSRRSISTTPLLFALPDEVTTPNTGHVITSQPQQVSVAQSLDQDEAPSPNLTTASSATVVPADAYPRVRLQNTSYCCCSGVLHTVLCRAAVQCMVCKRRFASQHIFDFGVHFCLLSLPSGLLCG